MIYISLLNYGDTDNVPINHLVILCHTHVIIQMCVLINHINMHINMHTHAQTHAHTHHEATSIPNNKNKPTVMFLLLWANRWHKSSQTELTLDNMQLFQIHLADKVHRSWHDFQYSPWPVISSISIICLGIQSKKRGRNCCRQNNRVKWKVCEWDS